MATERLDVRLDPEHRRKPRELAAEQGAPVSETVRRLIDAAYEDTLRARRTRAAQRLAQLEEEDWYGRNLGRPLLPAPWSTWRG